MENIMMVFMMLSGIIKMVPVSGEEGKNVIKIIEAAFQSNKEKK
jgi:hypothetical protein